MAVTMEDVLVEGGRCRVHAEDLEKRRGVPELRVATMTPPKNMSRSDPSSPPPKPPPSPSRTVCFDDESGS